MEIHELEEQIAENIRFLAKAHNIDTSFLKVNIQTVRKAYGAYSQNRWTDGENKFDEIALNPEMFDNPLEIIDTMIHELVHLYARQNNIKETTRGGSYHNKKFKAIAEDFGLKCIQGKNGWNTTTEGNEVNLNSINESLPYPIKKTMIRKCDPKKTSVSKHSIKYTCPECGISCRATKEIKIICAECDRLMETEI